LCLFLWESFLEKERINVRKKGNLWIIIGFLCIISSISLTYYNIWDEARADKLKTEIVSQIKSQTENESDFKDIYQEFPEQEMPTVLVEEYDYIGVLEIPALGLELPVMKDWSYPKLKVSPCRYDGSAYQNNLIISAHNYDCHFGRLKSLEIGEEIFFTDMDGNIFQYEVIDMEILQPTEVEEMKSGEWDLTLFTCTYGGQSRVTIRCQLQ